MLLRVGRAGRVELQGGSRWMLTSYPVATSEPWLPMSASATNDELQIQQANIHADDESDTDSDCAPPQTLAQELAERLKHVEDGSGRGPEEPESSLEQATPLEGEFYSEAGMQARMELLEKESIKQALEDLWTAANCVDPTDGIIDKQELTLPHNPGP